VYVYPWALRLLVVQMAFIYFCNGVYKLFGEEWRSGNSLYYVLNDLTLARWSFVQFPVPVELTRLLSWGVLAWEVTFPFWMLLPWLAAGAFRAVGLWTRATVKVVRVLRLVRVAVLLFGVAFHVGIFVSMEIGNFGPYMICLYLPLVPWERWSARRRLRRLSR
jgi:hypothetical protein